MSVVFLALFSLLISHIARYAPSSQKENHPKIQTETEAAYYLHVTKNHPRDILQPKKTKKDISKLSVCFVPLWQEIRNNKI